MSEQQMNWRKIGVKRERKYEPTIAQLNSGHKSIFQFIKDIMVFAAMVGYSKGKREPLHGDTIEIILETYSSDQKDGFIYLLALIEEKDGLCLKDINLQKSVRIFEEYCNAGLATITGWLNAEMRNDPSGIDTLMDKVFAQLCENEKGKIADNEDIVIEI